MLSIQFVDAADERTWHKHSCAKHMMSLLYSAAASAASPSLLLSPASAGSEKS
jgi:hypothetical protein